MNTVLGFKGNDRDSGYNDRNNCMGSMVKDDMGDKTMIHFNSLNNWQNIKLISGIVITGIGFGVAIPKAEAVVGYQCPKDAEVCIMGNGTGQIEMPPLATIPPEVLAIINQMPTTQQSTNTKQSSNKIVATPVNNPNIKNVEYISIDTGLTQGTSKNVADPLKICTNREIDLIIKSINSGLNTSVNTGVREVCENAFWTAVENDPLFPIKLSDYFKQQQVNEMGQIRREFEEYKNGLETKYTPNTDKNRLTNSSDNTNSPDNMKLIKQFINEGFENIQEQIGKFTGNSTKTNSTKIDEEQKENPWDKLGSKVDKLAEIASNAFEKLPNLLGGSSGMPTSGSGMPTSGSGMPQLPLDALSGLNPFQQGSGFSPFSQIPYTPSQQYMQGVGNAMGKAVTNFQNYLDENAKKANENVESLKPKIEEAQKTIDEGLSSAKEAQKALDGLENAEQNADSELKALKGILKSSIANGKLIDGYGQATTTLMQGGFNAITTRLDTIIHLDIAKLEALGAMSAQQAAAAHATQASLEQMNHNISRTSGATQRLREQATLASMGLLPAP